MTQGIQSSLEGFDDPSKPTDRLFFAVFPDPATAACIGQLAEQLRGKHRLQGRPLAVARFHITLHHLGDYVGLPTSIVTAASEAAASVNMPAFDVSFDRVTSFAGRPRNRPFVLRGNEGLVSLTEFQQTLGKAMKSVGLGRWAEGAYTPHVTLLYDDRLVPDEPVEPVRWTASEFVLVHSLLGRSVHVPLARWSLRG